VTAAAVAVNVAVVAADATVTEAGTVRAEVMLLERATTEPPDVAALERVTVQVVVEEAARVVLAHCKELRVIAAAVMVRVAVLLAPLRVAVMVGVWLEVTAAAVAIKVAVVAAEATVTEAGTVKAEVLLLERSTTEPPEGAAFERVTVQVVVEEAARVVLAHCKELRVIAAAETVRVAVLLMPLRVAVMAGVWVEVTVAAMAVNVAVVAPEATVTDAGTVRAEVLLLERVTTEPPEGAAFERVTVQVVVARIARVVLAHCRDVGVATVTSDKLEVALTPFSVALAVAV